MTWFYSDGGRQAGPVDDAALDQLASTGVISADTLVWRPGMPEWQPYSVARGVPVQLMPGLAALVGTLLCAECGRPFPREQVVAIGSAWACASCKTIYLQRLFEGGRALGAHRFGGFWVRFVARRVDAVLLGLAAWGVAVAAGTWLSRNPNLTAITWLVNTSLALFYEVYFVARRGATPGKMALGLRVVRTDGSKVSTGVAVGRFFADWLSQITLAVGYVIAAFDGEKRALHDRICETRVIYSATTFAK